MDPYEVLGVSKDADEETIKRAYKELVKKYHPDKYVNNPLADLAAEKMKEINKAYDMITKGETAGGSTGNTGGYGWHRHSSGTYNTSYNSARILINSGRLQEAENMLNQLPQNAEWYYLMGVLYLRRGWTDKGTDYIEHAVSMDPNNPEYRSARDQINNQRYNYRRTTVYGAPNRGMSTCDCCSNLLIADCCCECMGGDLIPCC